MFKVRSVPFLMIAALVTGIVQCVGLHRAMQLWSARPLEAPCPAPLAVVLPPDPEPLSPVLEPVKPMHRIGRLAVRADAVEIDVDGRRLTLPGYPAPRSKDHARARLTRVALTPDREQVAIAGECPGQSGMGEETRVPSCASAFVRLYRLEDGAHVLDLKTPWEIETEDDRRVLAMAFDAEGERLAVLIMASWSDCSWEGDANELLVFRVADGVRLIQRDLEAHYRDEMHSLEFFGDGLHLLSVDANGRTKRHVLHVRPAHLASATTAS